MAAAVIGALGLIAWTGPGQTGTSPKVNLYDIPAGTKLKLPSGCIIVGGELTLQDCPAEALPLSDVAAPHDTD